MFAPKMVDRFERKRRITQVPASVDGLKILEFKAEKDILANSRPRPTLYETKIIACEHLRTKNQLAVRND